MTALEIIGERGAAMPLNGPFWMRGMRPAKPAEPQRELPEFEFTKPQRWLSRAFLCAHCDEPIHEKRGESNHFYYGEAGPYCPNCSAVIRIRLARKQPVGFVQQPKRPARLQIIGTIGVSLPISVGKEWTKRKHKGTADKDWVTGFRNKIGTKSVADIPEPKKKRGPVEQTIAGFLDKVAEVQFLTQTQELPDEHPDRQMLIEMGAGTKPDPMKPIAIEMRDEGLYPTHIASDPEVIQSARLIGQAVPALVRLPDITTRDPKTGRTTTSERYATAEYIATLRRRIEWEQFILSCGPLTKTGFAMTDEGRLAITADMPRARYADPEVLNEARKWHKQTWLERHKELPDPAVIEEGKRKTVARTIQSRMTDEMALRYIVDKQQNPLDEDPGRVAFHAEEDPKPQRSQYPFGSCRRSRCQWNPIEQRYDIHGVCTIFGWDLYKEFLARWEHRQTDRGYAGPKGSLGMVEGVALCVLCGRTHEIGFECEEGA